MEARASPASLAAAALLAFLLLGPADEAAAWEQLRGGPDRAGAVPLQPDPLDVRVAYALLAPGEDFSTLLGPVLVETPHGLVGVVRDTDVGTCALLTVTDIEAGEARRAPLDGCRLGWFQGYDAANDAVLVCSWYDASGPVLASYAAASGALGWTVAPADLGVLSADAQVPWGCSGLAIDVVEGEVVGPFFTSRMGLESVRHRIAAIDLATGRVRWAQQVPLSAAARGDVAFPAAVDGSGANFLPFSATIAGPGILVTGIQANPVPLNPSQSRTSDRRAAQFAAAWMDRDGAVRGMEFSQLDPGQAFLEGDPERGSAGGSLWAVGSGSLAATALGSRLILVNPEDPEPINSAPLVTVEGLYRGLFGWTAPGWTGQNIVVPLSKSLASYDAVDLAKRWVWGPEGGNDFVDDIMVGGAGRVYVLATTDLRIDEFEIGATLGNASSLVVLDGDNGNVLQRVPFESSVVYATERDYDVPVIGYTGSWARTPVFVPVGLDRVAVVDLTGRVVLLGPAAPGRAPALEVSDAYPPVNAPVRLRIAPGGPPLSSVVVRWGDRFVESLDGLGPHEHAYVSPGRHELLATALYEDGTTGTSTAIIDVGGTRLSLIQQAFAPERQDVTFFVIGIAITMLGGVYGFLRVYRHRRLFRAELAALEATFARTRHDRAACEAELAARRKRSRGFFAEERLTASQLGFLENRVHEMTSALRLSLVDAQMPFLPVALHRQLQQILSDGRVGRWERESVLRAIHADPVLSPEQKRRLDELVTTWFQHDQGITA